MSPERYFIREAEAYLGLTEGQFAYQRRSGRIEPTGYMGRYPWYSQEALDALALAMSRADQYHDEDGQRLYSSAQAARLLDVSKQTLYYHMARGHIRPTRRMRSCGAAGYRNLWALRDLMALKAQMR